MIPQNVANSPIIKNRYLAFKNPSKNGADLYRQELNKHKMAPTKSRTDPCPISPNIIPNKNGNVTIVNSAGFASL